MPKNNVTPSSSHEILIKDGGAHKASLAAPSIMVDPATENAILNAQVDKMLENEKKRKISDDAKIKHWMKTTDRVELFNEYHEFPEQGGPLQLIPIEICCTYPKERGKIISETSTGLSLAQERELRLFPFVKNLLDGQIWTIGDQYVTEQENEAAKEWDNMRTEKPSLAEVYKRPPSKAWGCDLAWEGNRFEINKFTPERTPHSYYTFLVSKNSLLTIVKKI